MGIMTCPSGFYADSELGLYLLDFTPVYGSFGLVSGHGVKRMLSSVNKCKPSRCWLGWVVLVLLANGSEVRVSSAEHRPRVVLTNAAQVRGLSASEAATQVPVRLRGVVTALNPGASVFVQDASGGTFLTQIDPQLRTLRPGDDVFVEGVTYQGLFLPGIVQAKVTRLGVAGLPPPVRVDYDDLLSARFHYERVEIRGIVRSVFWQQPRRCPMLVVAMGSRKLDVEVVVSGVTNLPSLVDARVRVAGLAAGYINARRQLRSPELLVSRLEDLQVEVPPPGDVFDAPLTTSAALLNFTQTGEPGHRIRVRGVITHQRLGEALFLRDGDDGLLVETSQHSSAEPGDIVEVVGFPAMGRFGAFLEDAVFRVVGHESAPPPVLSSVELVMKGTNDANLVTIEAKLLDVLHARHETVLVMSEGNSVFQARLPQQAVALRSGSMLRLTGVCRVGEPDLANARFRANPLEVELLLRSPEDVTVLSSPSGWTTQRLVLLLGILLCLAMAAGAWVVLLRRRVACQTAVILEQVQREAVLEERHRMAREMHDTLAQSFSGLGFQLDALNTRLPAAQTEAHAQLATAREMVRHGRESLRRSLMNLRAQELERGDLPDALPELARQITVGTGIELRCEIEQLAQDLPETIETNLLRIGQECLANAVQHAHPKRIDLGINQTPDGVRMQIADDGAGFDPTELKSGGNGHFGWRGIRERAAQIGATVELETQPGRGTTVTVTVHVQT